MYRFKQGTASIPTYSIRPRSSCIVPFQMKYHSIDLCFVSIYALNSCCSSLPLMGDACNLLFSTNSIYDNFKLNTPNVQPNRILSLTKHNFVDFIFILSDEMHGIRKFSQQYHQLKRWKRLSTHIFRLWLF